MTTGITAALTRGTPGIIQNVNSVAARMEKITTGVTKRMEAGNTALPHHRWVWMSRTMWKLQYMESSVVVPVLKEDQHIIGANISERRILGIIAPQAPNSPSTTCTARINAHAGMRSITGVTQPTAGITVHQQLLLETSAVDTRLRLPISLSGSLLYLWASCVASDCVSFLKGYVKNYLENI